MTFVRVLPWFLRALWMCLYQTAVFFSSWWHGLPNQVELSVDREVDRARKAGITMEFDRYLVPVFRVVSYGSFFIGWVVFSHITVFVLWAIFR